MFTWRYHTVVPSVGENSTEHNEKTLPHDAIKAGDKEMPNR